MFRNSCDLSGNNERKYERRRNTSRLGLTPLPPLQVQVVLSLLQAATSVNYGASQTYTISPNTGYTVSSVTVDGVSVGAVTSYTFSNVTANHTIAATFTPVTSSYTLTVTTIGYRYRDQ